MNTIEKMHKIKIYLSRFETYVRISNLNHEFDINKYSEDFIIPLLKITHNWDLLNLNKETKNAKALDLVDYNKKIGVQVTSDTSIEKIKSTIQKFTSSEYKKKVTKVFFVFLTPKQKRYSADLILKISQRKIKFNVSNHLLDCADLYNRIGGLHPDKIEEAEKLLRKEFSDFKLKDEFTMKDYEHFRDKYLQCCLNNFSRLNFFGLSIPKKPREIELYSLFVEPDFSGKGDEIAEQNILKFNEFSDSGLDYVSSSRDQLYRVYRSKGNKYVFHNQFEFKHLFNLSKHIVILGNPGAGKSSLIKYSICKLIENDRSIFKNEDIYDYLPIRVELHKYNKFKTEGRGGVFEYVINNLADEFQLPVEKLKIDYFIKNFPILFFFDGLDEIFDIQERIGVRNDIENFIENNKIVRSVVTCRYESYEEVNLNRKVFRNIEVNDFDKEKISKYVKRWYNIEEGNEYVREKEVKGCLEQLKEVNEELKQNPLLLSLILILYRNEQDLPTSKLEIYEGCSQTLVDSRDTKEKKLSIQLKISNKVSVFSNMAYWQFSNEIKKGGVKINYNTVKSFISDHLVKKGEFEEREVAEEAAKEFLEFAKIRSIYFENKFTHKTFYEYFIAYYIYTNYYSKPANRESLDKILVDNIGIASWHVVLELLICKVDQNQIDFDEIDSIIDKVLIERPEETSYFFSSLLKHLRNVSPTKYRLLLNGIVANLVKVEETDGLIQKSYFDNLCSLLKIKKYKEAFLRIIESELLNTNSVNDNLYILLYELNSVNAIKEISNLLEENSFEKVGLEAKCKVFLLRNRESICDKAKAIKLLEQFCSSFGSEMIGITFKSKYRQSIFFEGQQFNWVAHLFNQADTFQELEIRNNKLTVLGLKPAIIQKVIRDNTKLFVPSFQKAIEYKNRSKKHIVSSSPFKFLIESFKTYTEAPIFDFDIRDSVEKEN